MGLASTLSTALTGLTAAETTIDVVGNNLANANTVGFKASEATFASQFLQTMSLGSAPNSESGGTNPSQIGLGTLVSEITPDFTQGTIETSSSALDMAIQGDGFFVVESSSGETLYTRNGAFKLNSENQLTTISGNRVLGYGINEDFQIQRTEMVPLEISLGGTEVAQATQNVYLEGTLTSKGEIADTAAIIRSAVLSDSRYSRPDASTSSPIAAVTPDSSGVSRASTAGGGMDAGIYWYKIVFCDATESDPAAYLDSESMASDAFSAEVNAGDGSITLSDVPTDANDNYRARRIYRTVAGDTEDGTYFYVGEIADNTNDTYVDTTDDVDLGDELNTNALDGSYKYYVTFVNASGVESRPSPVIEASPIDNGRIQLLDLPTQDSGDQWVARKIYRNTSEERTTFYCIATIDDADTSICFTDSVSDDDAAAGEVLDFNGPVATSGTPLLNVLQLDDNFNYESMFEEGTLEFTGTKGARDLTSKEITITDTTTLGELVQFMEESMGIVTSSDDTENPIPSDGTSGETPGGYVDPDTGQIVFVSNNGIDNAVQIATGALKLTTGTPPDTDTQTRDLNFSSAQDAAGTSAVTDFIAYDSLGMDVSVRITAVLESQSSTETVYRWFADSPDNQPIDGEDISVGTGLIYFDGSGNFSRTTNDTLTIFRRDVPSESPLEITLDFSELSGLGGSDESNLAVSRQDGSAPGTLTSFIVGEDGKITGVFSNGITRDLGQLRLARFTNPAGLEQRGENLYAAGVNSGLPIEGDPNSQGIGSIVSGAVELSNSDIGGNLIDLILASTMYRGNSRVITTTQEMMEELLALRR